MPHRPHPRPLFPLSRWRAAGLLGQHNHACHPTRTYLMPTLLETAATYLQNEDWNFDSDLENSKLIGSVNGDVATFHWFVHTIEEDELNAVRIYSNLPVKVPELRRQAIAELITRINEKLDSGNFEMFYTSGQVYFKTTLDLMDGTLTQAMLMRIFMINLSTTEQYLQTIMGVAFGGMEPATALEMREAEGEVKQ